MDGRRRCTTRKHAERICVGGGLVEQKWKVLRRWDDGRALDSDVGQMQSIKVHPEGRYCTYKARENLDRGDVGENVKKAGRLLVKSFEILSSFLPELCRERRKVQPVAAQEGKDYVIYQSKLFTFVVDLLAIIVLRNNWIWHRYCWEK